MENNTGWRGGREKRRCVCVCVCVSYVVRLRHAPRRRQATETLRQDFTTPFTSTASLPFIVLITSTAKEEACSQPEVDKPRGLKLLMYAAFSY